MALNFTRRGHRITFFRFLLVLRDGDEAPAKWQLPFADSRELTPLHLGEFKTEGPLSAHEYEKWFGMFRFKRWQSQRGG